MMRPRHFRRAVVMTVFGLAVLSSGGSAQAVAPRITHFDDSFTFTSHLCEFSIHVVTRLTGTETAVLDRHGDVIRTLLHNNLYAVWTNPLSGRSVIERDHLFAVVYPDLRSFDIGLNYHLSLPGGRVVLVDAGRLGYRSSGGILFEAGRHPIEDGNVTALCAALR
jgi:hypothetical protein